MWPHGIICSDCEEAEEGLMHLAQEGRTVCPSCLSQHYERCWDCTEYCYFDDTKKTEGNYVICGECYHHHYRHCEHCNIVVLGRNLYDYKYQELCQSCYSKAEIAFGTDFL